MIQHGARGRLDPIHHERLEWLLASVTRQSRDFSDALEARAQLRDAVLAVLGHVERAAAEHGGVWRRLEDPAQTLVVLYDRPGSRHVDAQVARQRVAGRQDIAGVHPPSHGLDVLRQRPPAGQLRRRILAAQCQWRGNRLQVDDRGQCKSGWQGQSARRLQYPAQPRAKLFRAPRRVGGEYRQSRVDWRWPVALHPVVQGMPEEVNERWQHGSQQQGAALVGHRSGATVLRPAPRALERHATAGGRQHEDERVHQSGLRAGKLSQIPQRQRLWRRAPELFEKRRPFVIGIPDDNRGEYHERQRGRTIGRGMAPPAP